MMGITNGIALAIIGLELPAAWGLLTFLANFIPNIGGPDAWNNGTLMGNQWEIIKKTIENQWEIHEISWRSIVLWLVVLQIRSENRRRPRN